MLAVKNSDIASAHFLLFNNENGICRRIDMLCESESEPLTEEFGLINKIINTNDIQNNWDFIEISEKFIYWGSEFITKQISKTWNIHRVKEIIGHLGILRDLLPMDSRYANKSFFNKAKLLLIFHSIPLNFPKQPGDYLKILFNIWTFCEKEIKNADVFCSTLKCVYECIKNRFSDDYIADLFNYADHVLSLYLRETDCKIGETLVIKALLNIVKVVVRSEAQAICGLHFWWRLICCVQAEMMAFTIFDPCVIPFLANLFGKYLSLDPGWFFGREMRTRDHLLGENFPYSLYRYNVFTNYAALGTLCNHAMTQLLGIVGDPGWTANMEESGLDNIKHLNEFAGILLTKERINQLLISCFYWCQSITLNRSRFAPSDFQLLEVILKCFSQRFLVECQIKQVAFNLLLRVLHDNLETMNTPVLSGEHGLQKSKCSNWAKCGQNIVNLIFPENSLASSSIMSIDLAMISNYWLHGWFNNNHLVLDRNVAIANLQCWFLLSSKLGQRLARDSFTSFSNDNSGAELAGLVEYMVAPITLAMACSGCVMIKNDYDEIWKTWEHFYVDFITKAALSSDFSATFWLKHICPLLMNLFNKVTNRRDNKTFQEEITVVFNMVCRCLRLVVLRTDDLGETDDKEHPLWRLLENICKNFPIFSSYNLKLAFRESASSSVGGGGVLKDFLPTPVGTWARWRIPFAAKFPCDLDSNFDTFLSLVALLIHKITAKKSLMLDIVGMLVPKLGLLSDALVGRELQRDHLKTNARNRQMFDEDAVQLENFITYLIGRIGICCLKDIITTDILDRLSPFLIYLFANEHGLFSRSTMARVINFWNDEVGCVENLDYSPEMFRSIKKLKISNKMIKIPDIIEEKMKDINISCELIDQIQDSSSLSEEPKAFQYGSIPNKVIDKEKRNSAESKDLDKKISVDENSTYTPIETLSDKAIPTVSMDNQKTQNKMTPVKLEAKTKEFYSPAKDVVKRSCRKRTCLDLLRKSSDTENQSSMEIKNAANIEKSSDNELSVDIVVNNPSDAEAVNLPETDSLELSVASIKVRTSTNIVLEDKENLPEEMVNSQPLPPLSPKRVPVDADQRPPPQPNNSNQESCCPAAARGTKPAEASTASLLQVSRAKPASSQLFPVNPVELVSNRTKSAIVRRNAFISYRPPLPAPSSIPDPATIPGSSSGRMPSKFRAVQPPLGGKFENGGPQKPPVIFDPKIPSGSSSSECSSAPHAASGYLTPIPVRPNKAILPQIAELASDLNHSLVGPQSLEKTRQTRKDNFESMIEQTIEHVKQALNLASAQNQKEIIRQLMAVIMSKI